MISEGGELIYGFTFISLGVVVFIIITIIIAITKNNTESTEMRCVKGKQPLAPVCLSPLVEELDQEKGFNTFKEPCPDTERKTERVKSALMEEGEWGKRVRDSERG